MNWKINYWTLVCFIILGGLVYSCMGNEKKIDWQQKISQTHDKVEKMLNLMEAPVGLCPDAPDTLRRTEAIKRVGNYEIFMGGIENNLPDEGKKLNLPVNFLGGALKLPKCEVINMWDRLPGSEAYILLTLETVPDSLNPKPGDRMISAIISERPSGGEEGKQGLVFDFIQPCPPYKCK